MTAAPGEMSRGPGINHRAEMRPVTPLLLLLAAGFLLRVLIAYVLLPGSGFKTDIGTFTAWAMMLAEHGPGLFYETASFADYPPGYLYVLWLVGGLAQLLAPLAGGDAAALAAGLIKMPPMLADVGVALVLYLLVRRWSRAGPRTERLGLLAAGLYLFNPVTWYDSAIWGQTDAVGALVLLLGVAALARGNSEGAAALAVLAALVKPQFGVVLAPLVGVVLLRRHLLVPGSGPRHAALAPELLRPWLEEERGAWRLLSSATVGLLVLLALIAPFSLDLPGFLERMAETAGGYEYLSVNAYNLWALVGAEGRAPFAFGGGWSPDTVPLLGPLAGVVIGAALLLGGFVLGLVRVAWRDDRRSIVAVAIFLALCFFVLPTRVHERYLFPVFALMPLFAVRDRRWLWAMVVLAIASFINLHGVLTNELYATPNVVNLPFGALFREPLAVVLSALLHTAVFGFVLWQLRPSAAPTSERAGERVAEPAQPGDLPARSAAGAPRTAAEAGAVGAGREMLGGLRSAATRLTYVVPVRRDRSAELASEPGGRLDRLDLLLIVLVLLSTLGLRTHRLHEPYAMHFDEVYHARTAVEFLQHWQYDIPHSIYEYTHPHLAKYLIAAGIVALGNNRVVEERDLGQAVQGALVERRWSPSDTPGERNGDRLFVLGDGELLGYDLALMGEPLRIPLDAEALALDEDAHLLYAADSEGAVWRLPTTALDSARHFGAPAGPVAEPEAVAQLELSAAALEELLFAGGRLLAIFADSTLVALDAATGEQLARTTVPGAAAALGLSLDDESLWVVAAESGFVLLDAQTLEERYSFATTEPLSALTLVTEGVDPQSVYAAAGRHLQVLQLPSDGDPSLGTSLEMPNEISELTWNRATTLLHALGTSQQGQDWTVYVVEPRSNTVFADAPLPSEPAAIVLDTQPQRPALDRSNLLALDHDGRVAVVDVGSNAFAWRLPGVIAGSLLAVAIYLLARFLFQRRSVALVASLLVLADGMFFANARIAMNDTYVTFFIVAALALFVPLWLGRWRGVLRVSLGLLGVGLLLGLALATKWVTAYAIGAVGLLILLRSALGRLLALLTMIGLTALLGYIAITPAPDVADPQLNYLFLLLMVGLTLALAVGMTLRPVRMSLDEVRLAVFGPGLLGVLLLLAGGLLLAVAPPPDEGALLTPTRLIFAGTALLVLANGIYLLFRLAGRYGHGPLAAPGAGRAIGEPAAPPPPVGWLRPGSGTLGLPWLAALGVVTIVPLLIYTLSYLPWIELGNRWTTDLPAGHTGQTFLELQRSMYDYHNYLRATHPASSPWWAWPLNLKPVWFEQEGYANDTTAVIYNTGNLVIFWLAIPAAAWVAYQAWRRRNLALAFLVVAIAALWLPWARIDRVAFQYHYFTVLPFAVIALAYFLGELWHGPSRRTWLLARVSAAVAILGPALLWLLRLPLCALGGVESVNPGSEVCGALDRQLVVTDLQLVGVLLAAAAFGFLALLAWFDGGLSARLRARAAVVPLTAAVLFGGLLLILAGAVLPATPIFEGPLRAPELPALLALLLLAVPAWYVLRARDPRRFVAGVLGAAAIWFVVWYPNFAGLPLPSRLAQIHLGLLPTWNYAFQFGANRDEPNRAAPDMLSVALLAGVLTLLVLAVVYTVRNWRAERREEQALTALHEAG